MARFLNAFVVSLVVGSSPLMAQEAATLDYGPDAGDREITLSGSGSSDNDYDSTNLGVTGSLGFYPTETWLLGVRQGVNFVDTENDGSAVNGRTLGFADYHFDLGRLRPFLGVAAGALYGEGVKDSLAAGPEGGLKYYADENTFVFGQVEYQVLFDEVPDFDEAFDDGAFAYTLGIGFNY